MGQRMTCLSPSSSNGTPVLPQHAANVEKAEPTPAGTEAGSNRQLNVKELDFSIAFVEKHFRLQTGAKFRSTKDVDFGWPKNFRGKYKLQTKLGSGSFATVYTAKEKSSGKLFAVKVIDKEQMVENPSICGDVMREVACLRALDRAINVANYQEAFEDLYTVKIVLEYCSGGDLMHRIQEDSQKQTFTEAQVVRIIKSCLRMLSACHTHGIVHRDIKPENMLFLDASADSPLKLTDFGLSYKCGPNDTLQGFIGTPVYMAPEVFKNKTCQKSEVWSVGCIMYQLLCGTHPFRRNSLAAIIKAIFLGRYSTSGPAWENVSSDAKQLLGRLLAISVDDRPTAKEALEHPWIRGETQLSVKPLDWTMFQRMQQFSTLEHPKLLQMMAQFIPEQGHIVEQATELFQQHDEDLDGVLNRAEFVKMLKKQKLQVVGSELDTLYKQIDLNEDGVIQLQELTTALLPWKRIKEAGHWDEILTETFKALDTDNSGMVDPDEISAYVELTPEAREYLMKAQEGEPVSTETGLTLSQFKQRFGLQAQNMMSLFEFDSRRIDSKIAE